MDEASYQDVDDSSACAGSRGTEKPFHCLWERADLCGSRSMKMRRRCGEK